MTAAVPAVNDPAERGNGEHESDALKNEDVQRDHRHESGDPHPHPVPERTQLDPERVPVGRIAQDMVTAVAAHRAYLMRQTAELT